MRYRIMALVTTLVLTLPLAGTSLADGPEVDRHGTCTKGHHWELDVGDEGTYLDADFEVNTSSSGEHWRIVLRHDGNVFFNQVRSTQADGDVEVERRVRDHAGSDSIAARGTNLTTGEVCHGSLSI